MRTFVIIAVNKTGRGKDDTQQKSVEGCVLVRDKVVKERARAKRCLASQLARVCCGRCMRACSPSSPNTRLLAHMPCCQPPSQHGHMCVHAPAPGCKVGNVIQLPVQHTHSQACTGHTIAVQLLARDNSSTCLVGSSSVGQDNPANCSRRPGWLGVLPHYAIAKHDWLLLPEAPLPQGKSLEKVYKTAGR